MESKDRFGYYMQLYNNELDRKMKINSELSVFVTMAGILVSAFVFCITRINTIGNSVIKAITFFTLAFFLIFLIRAVYCIIKANYDYSYTYIPTPEKVEKFHNDLYSHYKPKDKKDEEKICFLFYSFLIDHYCVCTAFNTTVNDKRTGYLYYAKKNLIRGFIVISVSVVLASFDIILGIIDFFAKL